MLGMWLDLSMTWKLEPTVFSDGLNVGLRIEEPKMDEAPNLHIVQGYNCYGLRLGGDSMSPLS